MIDRLSSSLICFICEYNDLSILLTVRSVSKLLHQCTIVAAQYTQKIPVRLRQVLRLYNKSIHSQQERATVDVRRFPLKSLQWSSSFNFDLYFDNPDRHTRLFQAMLLNAHTIKVLDVPNHRDFDQCIRRCANQLIRLTLSNAFDNTPDVAEGLMKHWVQYDENNPLFPKLDYFSLGQHDSFDNACLQFIAHAMPSLSNVLLDLDFCVSTCRLGLFMSQMPSLTAMSLFEYDSPFASTLINDWLFYPNRTTSQHLRQLSVCRFEQIPAYMRLLDLGSLEDLSLGYSSKLDASQQHLDRTVEVLSNHPKLSHLRLRLTRGPLLSDRTIQWIAQMKSLRALTVFISTAQTVLPSLMRTVDQIIRLHLDTRAHWQPGSLLDRLVDCLPRNNLQDLTITNRPTDAETIEPSIGSVLQRKSTGQFPKLRSIAYGYTYKFFL